MAYQSGRDPIYMRNFVKRHTDIMIKSMSSLEAKISYMSRNLNRQLKKEPSFPLILCYNYNQVIRPRGDLLKEKIGHFDLETAFARSDEGFCKHWGIDLKELQNEKRKRRAKKED